jgi:hypothetical protein
MVRHKLAPMLFIPDAHIPYEDKDAFDLMLKVARELEPEYLAIMGDFGDFFDVSDYVKDPRHRVSFEDEIDAVNKRLDQLDELKVKYKFFLEGNHETRLTRYILSRAPALVNAYNVAQAFELRRRAYKFIPYRSDVRIGKLYLCHDAGHAGINAVKQTYDAYHHNVGFGHTHSLGQAYYGNAAGESHVCTNFGWLGDKKYIDYTARIKAARRYITGFGTGYMAENGHVFVQVHPIVDNRCVVNGKMYSI